uniref:uncharacterized protein isoform X2 n=1 Tax=Myxine glutinosa TaxID=7769 RepID=UPI00358FA34E
MPPKRKSNFRRHPSREADRMRRRRRDESDESKERRLVKDRDYHRSNRQLETAEQRVQRLARDRDYHRGSRKHETPEQRLRRLTKDRDYHRESRKHESQEGRAKRLAQHRNYQRVSRMNQRLRYQLYNMEFRNILYAMNQPLMDRKIKQTAFPSDYVSDMGGSEGAAIDWKFKIPNVPGYPAYEDKDLLYPGDIDAMGYSHASHEALGNISMKEEPFDGTPRDLSSDSRPLEDVIVKVEVETEFEDNSTSQVKDFNRKLKVDPELTDYQMDDCCLEHHGACLHPNTRENTPSTHSLSDGDYPTESKHCEENVPHTSQEALDIIYVKEEPIDDDDPQELSSDAWPLEDRQFECKNAFPCSKCSRLFCTEDSLNLHMSECFRQDIINYSNGTHTNKRKRLCMVRCSMNSLVDEVLNPSTTPLEDSCHTDIELVDDEPENLNRYVSNFPSVVFKKFILQCLWVVFVHFSFEGPPYVVDGRTQGSRGAMGCPSVGKCHLKNSKAPVDVSGGVPSFLTASRL